MSEITKLEIWRDTGFTEGAVEVPKISSLTLSNPDFTIESGLFPSKDRLFSSVKIEGEWLSLYDTSYLRATIELNNPRNFGTEQEQDTIVLYGWIDNVSLVSDNESRPMTQIVWHVDYWRTYANMAHYGYGMITRRPKGEDDPIQSVPYRYRLSGEVQEITKDELLWVGVCYTAITGNDKKVSGTEIYWFPVLRSNLLGSVKFNMGPGETAYDAPTLSDIVRGRTDEMMGLDPNSISQVFVSPFCPFDYKYINSAGYGKMVEYQPAPTGTSTTTIESGDIKYVGKYVTDIVQTGASTIPKYKFVYSDGTETDLKSPDYLPVDNTYQGKYGYIVTHNGSSTPSMNFTMSLEQVVRDTLGSDEYNRYASTDSIKFVGTCTIHNGRTRNVSYASLHWDVSDTLGTAVQTRTFTKSELSDYYISADSVNGLTFHTITPAESQAYSIEVKTHQYTPAGGQTVTYGFVFSKSGYYTQHNITLTTPVKTTDTSECIITDLSGNAVGSLPWGREFSECNVRVVCDSISAFIELRFEGIEGKVNGTTYSIPLPHIDLTSNAWSSYNYSGQRDYDIRQRQVAREQAFISGVAGGISGAMGNAMLGYLGGSGIESEAQYYERGRGDLDMSKKNWDAYLVQPYMVNRLNGTLGEYTTEVNPVLGWMESNPRMTKSRALAVAGAGAVGGIAGSIAGSALEYAMQGMFNDQLQKTTDLLVSKQSESIASFGNGWDWMWYGRNIAVITLVPDNYSLTRYATDIALNGIIVSEPMSDTDTMIKSSEGPLQVTGLIVTGSIPVQAKYALQSKLASGVRLV